MFPFHGKGGTKVRKNNDFSTFQFFNSLIFRTFALKSHQNEEHGTEKL
jgi:hypothetical protein